MAAPHPTHCTFSTNDCLKTNGNENPTIVHVWVCVVLWKSISCCHRLVKPKQKAHAVKYNTLVNQTTATKRRRRRRKQNQKPEKKRNKKERNESVDWDEEVFFLFISIANAVDFIECRFRIVSSSVVCWWCASLLAVESINGRKVQWKKRIGSWTSSANATLERKCKNKKLLKKQFSSSWLAVVGDADTSISTKDVYSHEFLTHCEFDFLSPWADRSRVFDSYFSSNFHLRHTRHANRHKHWILNSQWNSLSFCHCRSH